MSLASILDLAASCLGLFSALFFCIGILHFTPAKAEQIATLFWGKGMAIAEEFLVQKSDFIVGALLLLLSFMVQFIVKAFPSFLSQPLVQDRLHGVVISVAIALSLVFVSRISNLLLKKVFLRQLQTHTEGKL